MSNAYSLNAQDFFGVIDEEYSQVEVSVTEKNPEETVNNDVYVPQKLSQVEASVPENCSWRNRNF